MKLKISPSQAHKIEGDEEERSIIDKPSASEVAQHWGGSDIMDGSRIMPNRIAELYERGLFTRAVVCWVNATKERQLDPIWWGIIVKVHPERGFPLEVHWADGKTTLNNGDDLKVIYRGITSQSCKFMLEETKGNA